jgi:hypothetical protein
VEQLAELRHTGADHRHAPHAATPRAPRWTGRNP